MQVSRCWEHRAKMNAQLLPLRISGTLMATALRTSQLRLLALRLLITAIMARVFTTATMAARSMWSLAMKTPTATVLTPACLHRSMWMIWTERTGSASTLMATYLTRMRSTTQVSGSTSPRWETSTAMASMTSASRNPQQTTSRITVVDSMASTGRKPQTASPMSF